MRCRLLRLGLVAALAAAPTPAARAQQPIRIAPADAPIVVDGRLDDPAWARAAAVDSWFEFRPGDNVEPKVRSRALLTYDARYLYAAFDLRDPAPGAIRAPLSDRDDLPDSTDHAGLIIDGTGDGQTAQMFFANPRGIQYDAILSDASGEDSAPDFYWDSAAHVTRTGWTLEIRIPFASLRYRERNPARWGVILYRNWPREFQYEIASVPFPRGGQCIVCNAQPLVGLRDLPTGGHWVLAPYANASRSGAPAVGRPAETSAGHLAGDAGLDVKWTPTPVTVVDATVNPDFSQIEADTAQITANEQFALSYPERRPFFLEGIDLFSTQVPVVYTRTITQPRWGARTTGTIGKSAYTALAALDEGGGTVVIPGSRFSRAAPQDFRSLALVGRWRHDLGQSYVSAIYSGREIDGDAYNRVVGPDFRWQPSSHQVVSGQFLVSESRTPDRPDLSDEWDGRSLSGHAFDVWWRARSAAWDSFLLLTDISDGFRADNGFMPTVGIRRGLWEVGRNWYPRRPQVSFARVAATVHLVEEPGGALLLREFLPAVEARGRWDSLARFEVRVADVRGRDRLFERTQTVTILQARPGRVLSGLELRLTAGDEIDYDNDRLGRGATVNASVEIRPSDHLRVAADVDRRWLDVSPEPGASRRLFTATVSRLRATWTFDARSWVRAVWQSVGTTRDPDLYTFAVAPRERGVYGSAVFAYKLNWQTVFYVGWADTWALDEAERLASSGRQFFAKIGYAWQR